MVPAARIGAFLPIAAALIRAVDDAAEMATHRKMGLTEIALGIGHASQTTFGIAFKRVTGVTPTQWRSELEDLTDALGYTSICPSR
jgi:AraC-like DNA-binding protein